MTTFRVGQMVRIKPSVVDFHKQSTKELVHELEVHVAGMPVLAEPNALEPYHEPGDYQTLSELLRGVVPAAKEDA